MDDLFLEYLWDDNARTMLSESVKIMDLRIWLSTILLLKTRKMPQASDVKMLEFTFLVLPALKFGPCAAKKPGWKYTLAMKSAKGQVKPLWVIYACWNNAQTIPLNQRLKANVNTTTWLTTFFPAVSFPATSLGVLAGPSLWSLV